MKLRVTVEGKSYEVEVDVLDDSLASAPGVSAGVSAPAASAAAIAPPPPPPPPPSAARAPAGPSGGGGKIVKAPIVGTVMTVKVQPGDTVAVNQVVLVMEAMKMETNVVSPSAGVVKAVLVNKGDAVKADQTLIEIG